MRTSQYKTTTRNARGVLSEETFTFGMQYTDAPLVEGANKVLVNFDFKDDGRVLIPRYGMRALDGTLQTFKQSTLPYICVHVGQTTFNQGDTDELHKYVIYGTAELEISQNATVTSESIVVAVDTAEVTDTPSFQVIPIITPDDQVLTFKSRQYGNRAHMHDMLITQSIPKLITCALNGVQYYMTDIGLVSFLLETDANNNMQGVFKKLDPTEITPTEAINYGYNMLKDNPYAFEDKPNSAYVKGSIKINGMLPYTDEAMTQLLFNAKVGTPITFRAFVEFPANEEARYKFRWEIRDLTSDAMTVFEDKTIVYVSDTTKIYNSVTLDEGVKLTLQPPYKQFSVTLTAFPADEGADDTEPIEVLNFAAYNLVGLTSTSLNQIAVKTYNLATATGAVTWKQRVVLWGVQGAKNILFVSDVNNPSYFPYPNTSEIFTEPIISCTGYLGSLLVFTETAVYLLTWLEDGSGYTTTTVQENLLLTEHDAETITPIRNLVYFKSGNYYYMIVPSSNANSSGELVLAPISNNITKLLDEFSTEVMEIFTEVFNPQRFDLLNPRTKFTLRLNDFMNFLDGNFVRNVYHMTLMSEEGDTYFNFDLVLNYNSVLRTWSITLHESNLSRMYPYRQTVTDTTIYINVVNTARAITEDTGSVAGYIVSYELVQPDEHNIADEYALDSALRYINNWQFIDTGLRAHDTNLKKRYRELQFKINNIEQGTLEFGMAFYIDNMHRREIYSYDVEQYDIPEDDPLHGWIRMIPKYNTPITATGATILDSVPIDAPPLDITTFLDDAIQSERWVLDFSQLATAVAHTGRVKVSGKGYAPRTKLLSFNEHRYELLALNWVFRTMNAR